MFISPAYAQTASDPHAHSTIASVMQYGPLVLIVLVFYFLLLRPQMKQQKAVKARQSGIKRGDRVVTAGGIIGVVKKATEGSNEVDIEIASNTVVTVIRTTITTVLTTADKP